ncbi:MAG: hypothetical protein GY875_01625 [Gammaproteobacteria bacterium]|nr:hypothetical protein [Gammaproteobacteria bacterium]
MKMRNLIFYLLFALPLAVAGSNLTQSDENSSQQPETPEQESADSDDDGGDRGFDPCLLNANLAICNQQ